MVVKNHRHIKKMLSDKDLYELKNGEYKINYSTDFLKFQSEYKSKFPDKPESYINILAEVKCSKKYKTIREELFKEWFKLNITIK